MTTESFAITLNELYTNDPSPISSGSRTRFFCPLCGDDKPRDIGHKSCSVDESEGVYFCFRCGAGGRLGDVAKRQEQSAEEKWERRRREQEEVRRRREILREVLNASNPIRNTPASDYLNRRGIPNDIACHHATRFAPDFLGRPAVLFLISTPDGRFVGAQGRYLDDSEPRMRTVGFPKDGAFFGFRARKQWKQKGRAIYLCEAPIDALTLEAWGRPAIATMGTRLPDFLKGVPHDYVLASDADEAGDRAAVKWREELSPRSDVRRERPSLGKDWNESLMIMLRSKKEESWKTRCRLPPEMAQ